MMPKTLLTRQKMKKNNYSDYKWEYNHNYGLAINVVEVQNGFCLWINENWDKIGQLGKDAGFDWGGN